MNSAATTRMITDAAEVTASMYWVRGASVSRVAASITLFVPA